MDTSIESLSKALVAVSTFRPIIETSHFRDVVDRRLCFSLDQEVYNDGGVVKILRESELKSEAVTSAPVFLLYKDYLKFKTDAQDHNLETFTKLCRHFKRIPPIDLVNWIIQKANIVDEKHRLNFPVYAFMEFFKFDVCISDKTDRPRLRVGCIPKKYETLREVWAGWPHVKVNEVKLYDMSHPEAGAAGRYTEHEYDQEVRKKIIWAESLERLFGMSQILEGRSFKNAVQVQDAIILSVVKVVLRFTNLMNLVDCRRRRKLRNPDCSPMPFTIFDRPNKTPIRAHPYQKALDKLNSGSSAADTLHRCHPPDQQTISGIIAARSRVEKLEERKRKRDHHEEDSDRKDAGSRQKLDDSIAKSSQT